MAALSIQKASTVTAPAPNPSSAPTPQSGGSERALYAIASQLRRIADHLAEKPTDAASEGDDVAPTLAPADEALFQSLRKWRADEARKLGMPPYIVATDRVLRAVAETRPTNVEDLRKVPGFGPAKTEKYGPGVVEVVAAA